MDFLISPAYRVPPMRTVRSPKFTTTNVPERVWLTQVNARNGFIEINGMSLDNELVALFLTSLDDSPYFADVELESTELLEREGLKLNEFRLRARLTTDEAGAETAPGAAIGG